MSSYNKQPESVLSRSDPTWYFFSITIFLHKMHGLDNMIHMYIIVYQFQFLHVSITGPVSPLSSPPLCKHARCEIPWAQHAWHPGDFWNLRSNLDAINVIISDVQNPLLVIDFARLSELWSTNQYIAIRWILNTADMNRLRELMFGTLSGEQWLDS